MTERHLEIVRKALRPYVDWGVFRSFNETQLRGGRTRFSFVWLEHDPFVLVVDPEKGTLSFKNVLRNVPPRSDVYAAVKRYIQSRYDKSLPAHRAIDPGRAEVSTTYSKGNVSIVWKVSRNQYAYAVKRFLNLLNEIFVLLHTEFFEYMVENFDASQE